MRDLFFVGFLGALLALGLRRPFVFVLAYAYVDIVSPQRLSYYLLNSIPISAIVFALALGGWLLVDDKKNLRVAPRQWLMLLLLVYAGYTTFTADLPIDAKTKWDWAWKAMVFAIFLPLTLRTRLRIEGSILFLILSASAIIIVGGLKTVASGGGYGVLNLMVDNNSGLYESSTISTVAIAIVPLILWLAKFGTVFPPDWRVRGFAYALTFACFLMPIGTEARTGLVCIAVLGLLMLRDAKRRFLTLAAIGFVGLAAIPFLPQSFTSRMETIQGYQGDSSASTRIAVWAWTWEYVQDHPLGGGFEAYRQNKIQVNTVVVQKQGSVTTVEERRGFDQGRAYHSSYFEILGEQGFPGLFLFLLIHGIGVFRMELIRRRFRLETGDKAWIAPLATALQYAQIIYLVGSLFVGIAFQPFVLMLLGVQIGLDLWLKARAREAKQTGFAPKPALAGA